MNPRSRSHATLFIPLALCALLGARSLSAAEDWTEIEIDDGLAAWRTANPDVEHEWRSAGEVRLKPNDRKLLSMKSGEGVLLNGLKGRTPNLYTRLEHADVELHVEFCVPEGSNSGVYFMGHYEIQVLDSFGTPNDKLSFSDCGGIYQRYDEARGRGWEGHAPPVNASKAPGEWQSFDVVFRAPKFDSAGAKIANAMFVKVIHNGVTLHENVEVTGPTRAAAPGPERPRGSLMLQGDHGPVAYRNLRMRPLQPRADAADD